jgi:pilus assembly protein Flp/PilA
MKSLSGSFVSDESGATATEYALIAGGISIAIVTTVGLIGGQLNGVFNTLWSLISSRSSQKGALVEAGALLLRNRASVCLPGWQKEPRIERQRRGSRRPQQEAEPASAAPN